MRIKERMGTYKRWAILWAVFLIFPSVLFLQENRNQVSEYQKRLEKTRREIAKLRQQIEQQSKEERSSLDQIAQIDRESDLVRDLLHQLKRQEGRLRQSIFFTNHQLLTLQEQLQKQKEIYAERLVHFYKHKKLRDVEIILSSRSLNQVLVWLKYSRKIVRADQRRLENLMETRQAIEKTNLERRKQLAKFEALEAEKRKEERRLVSRRKEKQRILKGIRDRKKFYTQQLLEYERAQRQLEKLIRESESNRVRSPVDLARPSEFPELKGRMHWPVKGKIIHSFGKVKHPMSDRYYMNDGVDIKASFGAEVRATCSGVVTTITWVRSLGNVLIINHYGGYHTVFAHLSEILVAPGEEVISGQVIGRVGDSGSFSGPMLHFQVWHNTKPVNPLFWLSRQPS